MNVVVLNVLAIVVVGLLGYNSYVCIEKAKSEDDFDGSIGWYMGGLVFAALLIGTIFGLMVVK